MEKIIRWGKHSAKKEFRESEAIKKEIKWVRWNEFQFSGTHFARLYLTSHSFIKIEYSFISNYLFIFFGSQLEVMHTRKWSLLVYIIGATIEISELFQITREKQLRDSITLSVCMCVCSNACMLACVKWYFATTIFTFYRKIFFSSTFHAFNGKLAKLHSSFMRIWRSFLC